jgi:putative membrane protein
VSEKAFFQRESKARITGVIREVEAQTSAELVVAVKHVSGSYRDADYLGGFALALATLSALLFLPVPFSVASMPVDVALAFALGAVFTAHAPPLRRLLLSGRRREAQVRAAAREAFVDRGISRTSGRNGILVLVSTFERSAMVVTDVGIDTKALGDKWASAVSDVERAASVVDLDAFVEALRGMGPALAAAMPHQADDVNELPDEVDES